MSQRDAVDVAADALRAAVCREHRLLLANLPKSLSDLVVSAIVQTAKERDDRWRANMQAHGAALRMIREAVEEFGPVASLESEDAVLLRGPEPCHSAEAIIDALARISTALRSASNTAREKAKDEEIAGLREALEPFAQYARACGKTKSNDALIAGIYGSANGHGEIRVGDCRRAAALSGRKPDKEGA